MTRIGVAYDADTGDGRMRTERALSALGDVVPLLADEHLAASLFTTRPDIVLHVARGDARPSRRLHVAAFLDYFGIPYLGSDALTQATCLQRARMKESLAYHGVPTPEFAVVDRREQLAGVARLGFPLSIRPARSAHAGCPRLIAHDAAELGGIALPMLEQAPDEALLIERVLPGDAFTCSIIGNGEDLVILPILALDCDGSSPPDGRRTPIAARVSDGLGDAIEGIAVRTWHALGLRDMARIDVQLNDAGVPSVCGIDPLPPLTDDGTEATVLAASRAAGLDDHELLQRCLLIAARRAGVDVPLAPRFARLPRRTPPGGLRAIHLS